MNTLFSPQNKSSAGKQVTYVTKIDEIRPPMPGCVAINMGVAELYAVILTRDDLSSTQVRALIPICG
jgi:hypothetical protein